MTKIITAQEAQRQVTEKIDSYYESMKFAIQRGIKEAIDAEKWECVVEYISEIPEKLRRELMEAGYSISHAEGEPYMHQISWRK